MALATSQFLVQVEEISANVTGVSMSTPEISFSFTAGDSPSHVARQVKTMTNSNIPLNSEKPTCGKAWWLDVQLYFIYFIDKFVNSFKKSNLEI